MSKSITLIFCVSIFLLPSCKQKLIKDFSIICEAYNELRSDKKTNPVKKQYRYFEKIEKEIKTEKVKKMLDTLYHSDQKVHYKLLVDAAKAAGLDDWSCPAEKVKLKTKKTVKKKTFAKRKMKKKR